MADQKVTALSAFTPVLTDLLYGVDDPGGTPISGKLTLQALLTLYEANITVPIAQVSGFTDNSTNWDTAYGWGNHASAGYITDVSGDAFGTLSDVTITGITSGEIPKWNGSAWINNTLAEAGIAAASHTHTVSELSDATANGRSLISAANYAAMRTLLDLEVGTDFYSISATNSAIDTDVATHAAVTATHGATGAVVGTTNSQTLTNKTLTAPTINSPTINTPTIKAAVVDTEADTGWTGTEALDPANGSVLDVTLTGNVTTLTDNIADGECQMLQIDDGTAYSITWPTITWVSGDGSAPTLQTTGRTVITVWKAASTLYGFASNGA